MDSVDRRTRRNLELNYEWFLTPNIGVHIKGEVKQLFKSENWRKGVDEHCSSYLFSTIIY